MKKIQKSLIIDEDLVEKFKKDAEKEDRSESFIVNEILKKHYKKEK